MLSLGRESDKPYFGDSFSVRRVLQQVNTGPVRLGRVAARANDIALKQARQVGRHLCAAAGLGFR